MFLARGVQFLTSRSQPAATKALARWAHYSNIRTQQPAFVYTAFRRSVACSALFSATSSVPRPRLLLFTSGTRLSIRHRRFSTMASNTVTQRLFRLSKTNEMETEEIKRRVDTLKVLRQDVQTTQAQLEACSRQSPMYNESHSVVTVTAKANIEAVIALAKHYAKVLQHQEAAQQFQLALNLSLGLSDATAAYSARHGLATALHNCGNYKQATQLWNLQLSTPQCDPDLATHTRRGAAATLLLSGQAQPALDHLKVVDNYYNQRYGKDQPPLMDICDMLAAGYWLLSPEKPESLNLAAEYYQRAWKLRREHQNTDWPQYLVTLHNYAEVRMAQQLPDRAEILWRELLGSCNAKYGRASAPAITALVGWADCLEQGEQALQAYEHAALLLAECGAGAVKAEDKYGFEEGEREGLAVRVEAGKIGVAEGKVHRGGPWGPPRLAPLTLTPDTHSY